MSSIESDRKSAVFEAERIISQHNRFPLHQLRDVRFFVEQINNQLNKSSSEMKYILAMGAISFSLSDVAITGWLMRTSNQIIPEQLISNSAPKAIIGAIFWASLIGIESYDEVFSKFLGEDFKL